MDWPLSQYELENYCKDKYTNIYGIHHYEDTNGITVNSDFPGAVSVSNYEYEDRINESKRSIKILNPRLIPDFVNQFNKLING
jgi:hypothetical protein